MAKKPKSMAEMLADPAAPIELKKQILRGLCADDGEPADAVLTHILETVASAGGEAAYTELTKKLAELVEQMMGGPLRQGTFERLFDCGSHGQRALVLLPDGSSAFCVVPDEELARKMCCGDTVWLEAQAKAVLFHEPTAHVIGEVARLERRLDGGVEVSIRDHGRFVYRLAARLLEQLEAGEAEPGSDVLVCPQRMMAFHAIPAAEGLGNMRFLSQQPVPDVVVARDIGAPAPYIDEVIGHLAGEMTKRPGERDYRQKRSHTRILTGIPGSGKTYSMLGFWNRMYALMSEVTGVPVAELPQRVMQLRVADVLSKWLGESDKNIARFFDEMEELAAKPFEAPDGRTWILPLLVCIEEVDVVARSRGDDSIHDRIQGTLLDRLDGNRPVYRDGLVVVLATTNVPGIVDTAFLRRVGGKVEKFGRLRRASFHSVFDKQLDRRPFALAGARNETQARLGAVADVTAWLFGKNSEDGGQVEISLLGRSEPLVERRRDFLTAALVERAVEDACSTACTAERAGQEDPGLTTALLMTAIDGQVRGVIDQLDPGNCERYLDLPDGARVGTVRRVVQPAALPLELERVS